MHLGVERAGLRGVAKRRDRYGMPSLPRESDPEVERGVRVLRPSLEHGTKRTLGLGELLLLQALPTLGEARVHTRYMRRSCVVMAGLPRKPGDRDREERSEIHGVR